MRTCKHLYQQGLTLVELMVAMAIGMILMLGATGVLISNQQTFRTSENLAGIQENGRIALEMLAGEIRQTGGNPCGTLAIANVLTPAGNPNLGLRGRPRCKVTMTTQRSRRLPLVRENRSAWQARMPFNLPAARQAWQSRITTSITPASRSIAPTMGWNRVISSWHADRKTLRFSRSATIP